MIWHVITRFGEADTFEPAVGEKEPRIHVELRRPADLSSRRPDALVTIAKNAGAAPDDRAIDLLSIAEAAFAADLRIARDLEEDRWTRSIRLHVPVADPAQWSALKPVISALLGYLTGDEWDLEFRQRSAAALKVPPVEPAPPVTKTVCLFSGGLDSLIAGIDLLSKGEPVALVGHYGAGLTNNIQQRVLAPLRGRYGAALREFRFGSRARILTRSFVHGQFSFAQAATDEPRDYLPRKRQTALLFDPSVAWVGERRPWRPRMSLGLTNLGCANGDHAEYPNDIDLQAGVGVEPPVRFGRFRLGVDFVDLFRAPDIEDRLRFGASYRVGLIETMLGANASVLTFGMQFSLNFLQTAVVYEFFRDDMDGGGAETRLSTEVSFRL